MTSQSPLKKALINVVDCLTKEEEKDLRKCLEELDKVSLSQDYSFEELKKDPPAEKAKVDLKVLPEHLKYVFLEDNEAKPVVISNSLSHEEESRLVEVLKKHRVVSG